MIASPAVTRFLRHAGAGALCAVTGVHVLFACFWLVTGWDWTSDVKFAEILLFLPGEAAFFSAWLVVPLGILAGTIRGSLPARVAASVLVNAAIGALCAAAAVLVGLEFFDIGSLWGITAYQRGWELPIPMKREMYAFTCAVAVGFGAVWGALSPWLLERALRSRRPEGSDKPGASAEPERMSAQ